MKRIFLIIAFAIAALTALTSCDSRREMFTERMVYGKVNINLDWNMAKSEPNGGTVVFFPDTASKTHFMTKSKILVMMNGSYQEVMMPYMDYKVVSFNETYEDFDFIKFRAIDSPEDFEAYTQSISVASKYTKAQEFTVTSSPDALYVDNVDTVSVVRNSDYTSEYDLFLTPERVSPLLSFRIFIKGMDNMAREGNAASISGLSEGINMVTKVSNNTSVAHMFRIDNRTFYENSYQDGYTMGQLYVFGVPIVPADGERNILTIYIRLRDGSDYTPLSYDITDKLNALRALGGRTNISISFDIGLGLTPDDPIIELPYVESNEEPGAGFDPHVDEWGEEIINEIPL